MTEDIPPDFMTFYREHLRPEPGQRVRSSELQRRYAAWATQAKAKQIGSRQLRRAMTRLGHEPFKSSLIFYEDLRFAGEPGRPMRRRRIARPPEAQAAAIIDRAITRLQALRLELGPR